MFELKIDDARYWKSSVDSIVSLIDEGTFSITKEGVSLKAMDPSGISMISFFMPNKAFSKYEVDKPATVGLNIANLSKILASSRPNEQLVMKDHDNKFGMEFIGQNSRRRYKLPMIEFKARGLEKAAVEFDVLKLSQEDREKYQNYIDDRRVLESSIITSWGEGEMKGRNEGIVIGVEQGIKQGRTRQRTDSSRREVR